MCLLLETLGLHYSGGGAGLAQDTRAGRERPLCVVLNLLHQWFKDHPGCLPAARVRGVERKHGGGPDSSFRLCAHINC